MLLLEINEVEQEGQSPFVPFLSKSVIVQQQLCYEVRASGGL